MTPLRGVFEALEPFSGQVRETQRSRNNRAQEGANRLKLTNRFLRSTGENHDFRKEEEAENTA